MPKNYANEPELGGRSCVFSLNEVLQIIDKYAERQKCDTCYHNKTEFSVCQYCTDGNKYEEQEPSIEKLKDKLHDKIEIYVCEVEENTLIAQGMLKALGMMDEVLDDMKQEPTTRKSCETCIGKSRYVDGMDLCEDCEKCSNFKPKQTIERR